MVIYRNVETIGVSKKIIKDNDGQEKVVLTLFLPSKLCQQM